MHLLEYTVLVCDDQGFVLLEFYCWVCDLQGYVYLNYLLANPQPVFVSPTFGPLVPSPLRTYSRGMDHGVEFHLLRIFGAHVTTQTEEFYLNSVVPFARVCAHS